MSDGFWTRIVIPIAGINGMMEVECYLHTSNGSLAVTPEVRRDGKETNNCCITHRASGQRLWPNAWPVEVAQRLLLELIALPGWDSPRALENTRLIEAATVIAKRYVETGAPTPSPFLLQ